MHVLIPPQVQDLLLLNLIRVTSPVYPGLAEWQHSLLVCQPLLPAFYHQQTCWGWTLSLHPGHCWRYWTRLDPVSTPGEKKIFSLFTYWNWNRTCKVVCFQNCFSTIDPKYFSLRTIACCFFSLYWHLNPSRMTEETRASSIVKIPLRKEQKKNNSLCN